jgi:hypothetical protein
MQCMNAVKESRFRSPLVIQMVPSSPLSSVVYKEERLREDNGSVRWVSRSQLTWDYGIYRAWISMLWFCNDMFWCLGVSSKIDFHSCSTVSTLDTWFWLDAKKF